MVFNLLKKDSIQGKKQIINTSITLTTTMIKHCDGLIINLNSYVTRGEKINSEIKIELEKFSELWIRLYKITYLIVNKYCENDKLKSQGSDVLSRLSQNLNFNLHENNPLLLKKEIEKKKEILKNIILELQKL